MHEKLAKKAEESIDKILKEGITTNNLEHLYKLTDIYKDAKEVENMNYGNYGTRRPGYDSYGRDNYGEYGNYGENYGRRGRDMRYRGDDYMDRMSNEYGEESDKAFHFMAKALGEYLDFLHEEADTPQKKQMLNETLQRSMR